MNILELPDLVLKYIFDHISVPGLKILRLVSKGFELKIREIQPCFRHCRISPRSLEHFLSIFQTLKGAAHKHSRFTLSLDLGFLTDIDDDIDLQEVAQNIFSYYGSHITELRLATSELDGGYLLDDIIKCPNLEYLWVGKLDVDSEVSDHGLSHDDSQYDDTEDTECKQLNENHHQNDKANLISTLLDRHSKTLVKLDLWYVTKLNVTSPFANLHVLKTDVCPVKVVVSVLKLCSNSLTFLCIANSHGDKDQALDLNLKFDRLNQLILCNSHPVFLDIITESMSTLQSCELTEYRDVPPHYLNFSYFIDKLSKESSSFECLENVRIDHILLYPLVIKSSQTLESFTLGFHDCSSPVPVVHLPRLKDMYFGCKLHVSGLIQMNRATLQTFRCETPLCKVNKLQDLSHEFPSLVKIIYPYKYRDLFSIQDRSSDQIQIQFGSWQEMFIFPSSYFNIKVWTGPNGPYGPVAYEAPIMRIVHDDDD